MPSMYPQHGKVSVQRHSTRIRDGSLTCTCWLLVLSRSECLGESLQLLRPHWGLSSCRHYCIGSVWGHRVHWHHMLWIASDLKWGQACSEHPKTKWLFCSLFTFCCCWIKRRTWPKCSSQNKYSQNSFKWPITLCILVFDSFSASAPENYHDDKHSFNFSNFFFPSCFFFLFSSWNDIVDFWDKFTIELFQKLAHV